MQSVHFNLLMLVKMSHPSVLVAFIFFTSVTVNCYPKEYYQKLHVCSTWCRDDASDEPFQQNKFKCCAYKEKDGNCPKSNQNCPQPGDELECIHDFSCPFGYKCCSHDCFVNKICQPITFDEKTTNVISILIPGWHFPKTSTQGITYGFSTTSRTSGSTSSFLRTTVGVLKSTKRVTVTHFTPEIPYLTTSGITLGPDLNKSASNVQRENTTETSTSSGFISSSTLNHDVKAVGENENSLSTPISSNLFTTAAPATTGRNVTIVLENVNSPATRPYEKFGSAVTPSYIQSSANVPKVIKVKSSTPSSLFTLLWNYDELVTNKTTISAFSSTPRYLPITPFDSMNNSTFQTNKTATEEAESGEEIDGSGDDDFSFNKESSSFYTLDDEDYYDNDNDSLLI